MSSLTSSSLCPHSLLWRKVLECSSSLLTSSSLCPHSLLWRKFLECSSSPCSLRYPCVLTHFVIPVFSHPSSSLTTHSHHLCYHAHSSPPVLTSLLLPLTHTSVLTLSVLTPIVIPDYSLTPLVSHSLTHPRVLSHLTSLSAHTHHLSSHTHHLTSSVTTRTLTSFSLVSPH